MVFKKLIKYIFVITDKFNKEWHFHVEREIGLAAKSEGQSLDENKLEREKIRSFYYERISNSSNLLFAISGFCISVTALIIAIIALFKS
ncbi:hypothetical protein [Photobacterium leiognathi]|uniref:hypothetical protein n=1 Tax=Photobacterium leiognathi TaxID=553611 RepID=UPI00273970A4|nr:hypothetical protein [Photobacterium leiognathi]